METPSDDSSTLHFEKQLAALRRVRSWMLQLSDSLLRVIPSPPIVEVEDVSYSSQALGYGTPSQPHRLYLKLMQVLRPQVLQNAGAASRLWYIREYSPLGGQRMVRV